jgi:hypothetical protein
MTDLTGPFPRYHQIVDTYTDDLEDGGSCFVSLFGPEQARFPNIARLTVSTHTRVEPWWRLPDQPRYQQHKADVGERLLAAVERVIPDVRRRITFSEVASPRSFLRWTGRHEGRVGGVPQSVRHANLRAQSHRTGLPGLFQCGDTVFPGQGTIGVTLSGINVAQDVARHVAASRRHIPTTRASRPPQTITTSGQPGGRT